MNFARYALGIAAVLAMLEGCGRAQPSAGIPAVTAPNARLERVSDAGRQIRNVIIIVQQTRSFDNLFAGFPGSDAPEFGYTKSDKKVPLATITLKHLACEIEDRSQSFRIAYDDGKMNGWNLLDRRDPLCPYTRVARDETRFYWNLAKQYALADRMFESTHWGYWVNQLYLIAGTTKVAAKTYDIGMPTAMPADCDAPPGTKTSALRRGRISPAGGPFPCFYQFPTIANLLDRAKIGWRAYDDYQAPELSSPFRAIQRIIRRDKGDLSSPATNVLSDLANGKLATISWVISPPHDSDAPGTGGAGPHWVKAIVEAAQQSRYWPHAAVIVVWSNSGDGLFYDDVAPPQLDEMGLGFRVPMIVASPYAKRGFVSHTQYEFGSILKFLEENWNLGSLGATDERANSIGDIFDL
jgi:phospholipase C